ncbi:MAG TPA: LptF/LptG family permease [Deltaproteobacteria bacterium]|nr:LptF/LptG family permease [Deltaproteobacteria bacterium]
MHIGIIESRAYSLLSLLSILANTKNMDKQEYSEYNPAVMIIQRYVLNHLLKLFLGASLVLYGVMLIVELVQIGQLVSGNDLDIFILALIPTAVFVLPMALIFSILMALEKLSVESEIIAMQACGIRRSSIYGPILGLSFVCMFLHVGISTYLGPLSMQKIQSKLIQKAPEKVYAFLTEREFINTFKGITLYIESVNRKAKRLTNVFIETKGKTHSVIAAEKGTIDVRPSGILMRLVDGSLYMESKKSLRYITFGEYDFFLEADFRRKLNIRSADTLTQTQLLEKIRGKERTPKLVKEYYTRFAFPFLNVILGLVGLQFGIQKPRSPRHTGIVVGIATILCYYLIFLMADRLVKGEVLNPTLGAWIPDIFFLFLLGAFWAFKRLRQRKGAVRLRA